MGFDGGVNQTLAKLNIYKTDLHLATKNENRKYIITWFLLGCLS